jgi:macrolide-specific efflux system membrane fusion protein
MRRIATISIVILLTAGAAAYYLFRWYWKPAPASASAVSYVQPESRELASTVTATGTVRLKVGAEVRVGSQLSGIVKKLNVTVGSHIKKGDVIAEIDSRGLEARIGQARAQITMDEVALKKARRDLERSQQLFASALTPRKEVEDNQAAVEAAAAKLAKSKEDLRVVEVDLAYIHITAPISGTIASVSTQEGETVAASFAAPTFVTIIEDNALEVVAMVDETDIANVHVGNPVTFSVETYPGREFEGAVKRISPKATIVSGVVNYEVGIAIGRYAASLKPDMTAGIFIKSARRQVLVIPDAAIGRDGDERFVYIAGAGGPEKRAVATGIRDMGFTEIKKGLGPSDRVQYPAR